MVWGVWALACVASAVDGLVRVPITAASVDYANDVPTPAPKAVLVTFYDGPLTRGFSWQTDTSVTASEIRLLKGIYGEEAEAQFVRSGMHFTGVCTTVSKPSLNCHLVHTEELEAGATYSYRLGGDGHYVYGRFAVKAPDDEVVIVNLNDIQTKTAAELYKAENSVAISANVIGGAGRADIYLSGGDVFDLTRFQFPQGQSHVVYGSNPNANYVYWKWGISVETSTRYYPGVPWLAVAGNHDYSVYRDVVAANWRTEGLSTAGCQALDYGKVHVATIPYLGSWAGVEAQYRAAFAWLDADLKAASNALWKVVATHWGPYTTGDHGCSASGERTDDFLRALTPILSSNHVDIVLQAHDHTYSKTVPYRWDTCGYTAVADDGSTLNLNPQTVLVGGERFEVNPRGTYYVSCGSCGHRVYENPEFASATGATSYRNRNPRAVMGTVSLTSKWMTAGSDASRDLNAQMFGVLRFSGRQMHYDWYVAEVDGTATKVDTLRVLKMPDGNTRRGTIFSLE